MLNYSMGSGDF